MNVQFRTIVGIGFLVLGVLVWLLTAILPLASAGQIDERFLGVALGAASAAIGVMLLAVPARPRDRHSRRSDQE
jgi:thiol:disulfide interchange protein